MKYLEELNNGTVFIFNDTKYMATCDFDNNNKRLCINLVNGQIRWLPLDCMTNTIVLYFINENNEILPLK